MEMIGPAALELVGPSRPAVVLEFPMGAPLELSAEKVSLESLVHHREAVDCDLPLEAVETAFRERHVDYLAVVREGKAVGLCAQLRLGALLGRRYGFALYARSPAHLAAVPHPLIFKASTPIRQVLDAAMPRRGDEFHEDVILVDDDDRLLGLISVEALAQLQTRLVAEQLDELQRQHETLRHQNLSLFQAGHAQRQAQGLYQGLFESNTLGVALLDTHGNMHARNRRMTELLNLAEGPLPVPSLETWMDERDRERFGRLLAAHERATDELAPATHEFALQIPGRGHRLFRFTTGWIRETGQVCACLDDITEQRSLERNVARQEKQRLLDTLVGGIAHELNNKLTPVIGFADMLKAQLTDEHREHAGLISQSAHEASRIIRQLLQLSKPETGRPQNIDLRAVVEESLLVLKFQLRERECTLRRHLAAEPVMVRADAGQVKQVIINLVLNAAHAIEGVEAPEVAITVATGPTGPFLSVADNGTGIAPEHLGRIFDPFFTTKGPDRGSGLGLSICYSIARQYGGDIAVESQVGVGTTFTLALPEALGVAEAPAADATMPAPGRKVTRTTRVLVAEDEDVVRRLLQEVLRARFSCRVDAVANGAEALELLSRFEYDMVISDIRMPVMAGPEFYLQFRQLYPERAGRFAFITGHPGEKSLQDEIAGWGVPVLAKPFAAERLIELCRPLLAPVEGIAV